MTTIAIDFGTTNTVVSILEDDYERPETIEFSQISRVYHFNNHQGKTCQISVIPSLVYVHNNQELILGEKVKSLGLHTSKPERYFQNFKRDLVSDFKVPPRYINGNIYDSKVISDLFITKIFFFLKEQNIQPKKAIFTVPVNFYEGYLNWFQTLADKLNIEQTKLIDECTAATLGYNLKNSNSLVLIIDFGGGILNLSLIRTFSPKDINYEDKIPLLKPEIIVKSDAYVGGEDIDIWIAEYYLDQHKLAKEKIGKTAWQNLLEVSEKLKIALSHKKIAQEIWLDESSSTSYELELTRDKLEEILKNQQLFKKLRYTLGEVLHLALGKGINKQDLENVLLIGGSCLIPAIQQLIITYFGEEKVKFHKPLTAVCHGALGLFGLEEIDDYLHDTYAIRLWNPSTESYSYFPLFEKGLNYPCRRKEPILLQVASIGQTEIRLDIGKLVETSKSEVTYDDLGQISSRFLEQSPIYHSLELNNQQVCIGYLDPPGEVGIDRISADFEVDENGTLLVTIQDLLTGKILINKQAISLLF